MLSSVVAVGLVVLVSARVGAPPVRRAWLLALSVCLGAAAWVWPVTAGPLMIGSHGALISFGVANWRLRAVRLLTFGVALNVLVMAVNGGQMPTVGSVSTSALSHHMRAGAATPLAFLGAILPMPSRTQRLLSVGEVFAFAGALLAAAEMLRRQART